MVQRLAIRRFPRRRVSFISACALAMALLGVAPAHERLAERLERGETITVVALGDSLAAGFELSDPKRDAYPSIFASVLQRRYPRARIRLIPAGIPGDTARGGVRRIPSDVLSHNPDLVTIQFGGNDHGRGRAPAEFERDLEEIVRLIREQPGTAALLATPPIVSPDADTPMVRAVKEIGKRAGIPVADFDGAIRARGTGPRGPFPFGRHPDARLHAVMARSLYEAVETLLPCQRHVRVRIQEGARYFPRADSAPVEVLVEAPGPDPVTVVLECDGVEQRQVVDPGARTMVPVSFQVSLAKEGVPARRRLFAWARTGDAFDYDLRWLTATPVARAGQDGLVIDGRGLVLGRDGWRGPDDLSGRATLIREGDFLHLTVTVEDDRVVRNRRIPNAFDSDCVELFLDCRPAGTQARPYWEQGVVGLFIQPGTSHAEKASWKPLEPLPDAWQALEAHSALMPGGYRIDLRIPLSLLGMPGARYVGFDLALDDADGPRGRRMQMVWAGGADDFLDPSLFGAVDLEPEPWAEPQMRVSVW